MPDSHPPVSAQDAVKKNAGLDAAPGPQLPPIPPPSAAAAAKKRKRRRRTAFRVILSLIVVAGLVTGGVFGYRWLFAPEEKGELLTDTALRSSIQSRVEGSGTTKAKDSATIILGASGTVVEVFVAEGDQVFEGQPLFHITSAAAEEAVVTARETLYNRQKELSELWDDYHELNVRAPFAGQLQDIGDFTRGDTIAKGTKIATIVDNTKMKLSLYFSYAYETEIYTGQSARISVPSAMSTLFGHVSEINKVRRVSPEGSVLFEVVVEMDNPGTLTAGTPATAALTTPDGGSISPYDAGTLAYNQTASITARATGPLESSRLIEYLDVSADQILMVLGDKDTGDLIRAKQKEVDDAQERLDDAQKALDNFSATAPIGGTVISCSLTQGMEVESGRTAITISDTSVMTVEIQVDERNVGFVKSGMSIELNQWGNIYMGVVESLRLEGAGQSGMAFFPAIVQVENYDGQLLPNMYVTYSFVASQSDNCLVIPIQCVRYISDENGDPVTVVFLQAEERPETAVTLSPEAESDLPEGFYAVPVSTGLSDTYNIEITEGLQDGDVVFTNFVKQQGNSWDR